MSKNIIFKISAAVIIIAAVFLTGLKLLHKGIFAEPEKEADLTPIPLSEATSAEMTDKLIAKVKAGDYENITGSDIHTDIKSTSCLDVISWQTEPDTDETVDELCFLYTALTGKQADRENICISSFDDISGCDCDTDKFDGMHKLSNHRQALDDGSITANELDLIDNESELIICCPTNHQGGLIVKMDSHSKKLLPDDLRFTYWMPALDEYSTLVSDIDLQKDKERIVEYADGACSVSTCVKNMQAELDALCPENAKYSLKISKASVYDYFGSQMLCCDLDVYYDGIRFEAVKNGTAMESLYINKKKDLGFDLMPVAVSAYQGSLCFYIGDIPRAKCEVYETLDTAAPPDEALYAVSQQLTDETEFMLSDISLCYVNDSKRRSPSYPYWRFCLKNTIDGQVILAYVGCKDGSIYIVPV